MSPSIEYTPSTATRAPSPSCSRQAASLRRSPDTELWRNDRKLPEASLAPSMMLAWLAASTNTVSREPTRVEMVPRLTEYPVVNTRQASPPSQSRSSFSSSRWMGRVPFISLLPVHPVPNRSTASTAARLHRGIPPTPKMCIG